MTGDRFVHEGRPLRDWLLQLVGDSSDLRREAAKVASEQFRQPMELLLQPGTDVKQLWEEFNEAVRQVVRATDFPAADFVRQLFTLSMALEKQRMDEWNAQQKTADIWEEEQLTKLGGDSTDADRTSIVVRALELATQQGQPEAFETGFALWHVIDALGAELLPAAEQIRHMLKETHQGDISSKAIIRMGAAGWEFYPDLFAGLERRDPNSEFSHPLGLLLRHYPERVAEVFACVESPLKETRCNALKVLGYCGRETIRQFPEIEARLQAIVSRGPHQHSSEWFAAAYGLARIGVSRETVSLFLGLTKTPPWFHSQKPTPEGALAQELSRAGASAETVAGTAIECLGELALDSERVVPRLIELLAEFEEYDPDYGYSGDAERVVGALEAFGAAARPAVPILANRLWRKQNPNSEELPELDRSIVRFFGTLGPSATDALPALLAVRAEYVRRARQGAAPGPDSVAVTAPLSDDELCPEELVTTISRILASREPLKQHEISNH